MLHHRVFMENAEECIQRNGLEKLNCYVIYFDIIEFKMINHYYGAIQGDALLKEIEAYIQTIPGIVLYERVFSDQYVLLGASSEEWTDEELIEKFHARSEAFLSKQRKRYRACTLEIACGIYRMSAGENFREAVDGANLARKTAKSCKSELPVVYNRESVKEVVEYRVKEQGLIKALEEERFIFYLQPKVSLLTGEIIGAEALARYVPINESDTLAEGSYMDEFLDIMEKNGSTVKLDRLVLKKVCEHLVARRKAGLPVVRTSVNLSRHHIRDMEEPSKLHGIVQQYGISPELLEFELNERVLMDDFAETKQFINKLRNYGYTVSIDDFGSGYAGINIWQELDFDTLKLDKIFLSEQEQHQMRNKAIVPNLINIAQRLNTEVICEGVENEEQCQYLLHLGCTAVQGYFFAKPAQPDEFYRVYEELSGRYELSFNKEREQTEERAENFVKTAKEREKLYRRPEYLWLLCNGTLAVLYGAMELTLEKSWFSFLAVFGVTLAVGGFLYRYLRRWRRVVYVNEQRYAIMEQFSDTVLFSYDIKKDEIRFTPNVLGFFNCSKRVYAPFCKVVEESDDIFLGDREEILNVIYGNPQNHKKEIRIRLRHPEKNEFFWCLAEFKYVYDEGEAVSIIGRMHNIDTQYRTEQILVKQSSTDALTGLLNRAWTEDKIKEYLSTEREGTLLVVDVDDFKQVNDNYGHETGDHALCYVADSLKSICRSDDVAGRMGGDEFIIYLRECTDREVVYEKMKLLRERLENAEKSFGVPLSVSVGAARYPMDGMDYRSLFHEADQAMYEAKNTGKNTCIFRENSRH